MTFKLDEQVQEIVEEIVQTGTMLNTRHKWTRDKIDEKEVEILGVVLKYDILKFHVEDADPTDHFEDDRIEYRIQNKDAVEELKNVINSKIGQALGDESRNSEGTMISITTAGDILHD